MMCGHVSGKSVCAVWISAIALLFALEMSGGVSFLIGADEVVSDQPKATAQNEKRSLGFQGRCVDENQQPLANVTIRLFEGTLAPSSRSQTPRPLKLRAETTTDVHGKFSSPHVEFRSPTADGMVNPLLIVATREGKFTTAGKLFDIEIPELAGHVEGAPLPKKMTMVIKSPIVIPSKIASLTGTVTDADGTPVPRAQVTLYAEGVSGPIPGMWTSQTDQNGRYSIDDVIPWKADPIEYGFEEDGSSSWTMTPPRRKLAITHEDFPMTIRDIEETPARVDIQFPPTVRLQGIVVDGVHEKSATNAVVKARALSSQETFEAATGIDGRYRLTVPRVLTVFGPKPLIESASSIPSSKRICGNRIAMSIFDCCAEPS